MQAALVYNADDRKLQASAYSWSYRRMFHALVSRFGGAQHITESCSAQDIEADVIIFYDVHSSHHIKIDGLDKHPAIKVEYFNDPHQQDYHGFYRGNVPVYKMGPKERCARAIRRGVRHIICPYRDGYRKYLAPHLGNDADDMLLWFPIAVDPGLFRHGDTPLTARNRAVLANGALVGPGCYEFRKWAHNQQCVQNIAHWLYKPDTPNGGQYGEFITQYAGVLALMDFYPVPKYWEIPAAGCVCFAQHHNEYEDLGFRDYETCIYVTRATLADRVRAFTAMPEEYQHVAIAGRQLILNNYTAGHFGDYIYDVLAGTRAKELIPNGPVKI